MVYGAIQNRSNKSKKLIDLGYFLAQPKRDRKGLAKEAAILGAVVKQTPEPQFEVHHANWRAYLFYESIFNQRYPGFTGLGPLNHAAIESTMNMNGIKGKKQARLLNAVLFIESGYQKAKKEQGK